MDKDKDKEYVPMWNITEPVPRIKEYKTIVASGPDMLDSQVNLYLQRGWQIYGHPHHIHATISKTHLLVQTVVLYENVKEKTVHS
ncbi:MAG: DUF1737 domain-containing protein [Nitrosopumilaceae archaeon]